MIKVWFDGACWPNPGGTASYGWATSKEGYFHQEGSGIISKGPLMSNNVAEYTALYEGLKWLKENNHQKDKIQCYGDSKLVIEQMSKRWRVKGGLYVEAFKNTFCMAKEFTSIRYIWIPRLENGLADYLSKKHLNLPPDIPIELLRQQFSQMPENVRLPQETKLIVTPATTEKEADLLTSDPVGVIKN